MYPYVNLYLYKIRNITLDCYAGNMNSNTGDNPNIWRNQGKFLTGSDTEVNRSLKDDRNLPTKEKIERKNMFYKVKYFYKILNAAL